MDNGQDKTEWKDLWLLTPEQVPLLSGMTDKGRLGFAIQLKFMEIYGRFPSSGKDVSMDVIQYLAQQLGLIPLLHRERCNECRQLHDG